MKLKPRGTEAKSRSKRLLGIELMRGVAAFAVVLSHSGDGTWGEMGQGVVGLRSFFSFHVPFFLAISFFFTAGKFLPYKHESHRNLDLKPRVQRIILPYLTWSIIYILFRSIFFIILGESEKIANLYGDIPSLIFFGGASYQLYFLPMLLVGTITFYTLNWLSQRWNLLKILLLLFISLLARIAVLITGNQFHLGPDVAFQAVFEQVGFDPYIIPLRIVAVFTVWAITCFPYISVALLLRFLEFRFSKLKVTGEQASPCFSGFSPYILLSLSTATFLIANFSINTMMLTRPFQKVMVAFSLVGIAISLPKGLLEKSRFSEAVTASLGKCALGIYLIHPLIIRFVRIGVELTYPDSVNRISVFSILLTSSTSFSISWLLISKMIKSKFFKQFVT